MMLWVAGPSLDEVQYRGVQGRVRTRAGVRVGHVAAGEELRVPGVQVLQHVLVLEQGCNQAKHDGNHMCILVDQSSKSVRWMADTRTSTNHFPSQPESCHINMYAWRLKARSIPRKLKQSSVVT